MVIIRFGETFNFQYLGSGLYLSFIISFPYIALNQNSGDMFVGLDRYMGIAAKTPPKKKTKKKNTEKVENFKGTEQKKDISLPSIESKNKIEFEKPESFSFITIHLKCPSCKRFTKILKKPQSFTPTVSDLICPKCGGKLKTTKK